MKKAFLVVACVCFVVAATSCKKDCVCSGKATIEGLASVTIPEQSVGEMSKSDCESYKYEAKGFPAEAKIEVTCTSK